MHRGFPLVQPRPRVTVSMAQPTPRSSRELPAGIETGAGIEAADGGVDRAESARRVLVELRRIFRAVEPIPGGGAVEVRIIERGVGAVSIDLPVMAVPRLVGRETIRRDPQGAAAAVRRVVHV